MSDYLQPQLKNFEEIKKILQKAEFDTTLPDGREVSTLLVYLPIKSGVSSYTEFFDLIKSELLANFVLSCSEIEKKLNVWNDDAAEKLFEKSLRKMSKKTAQGELGELILFTLLDVYFGAPKILSKVSLKSNRKMPVFGADAVHGQFLNGRFRIYLGESKLYTSYTSAATAAVKSIKSAKEKYFEEFDLLDSYMDFPNISKTLEEKLISILNPFSDKDVSEIIHSPCFIGFAEPEMIRDSSSSDEFIEKYKELAAKYMAEFYEKLEGTGVAINDASLLLLPYSSVDHLVTDFIKYLGVKE